MTSPASFTTAQRIIVQAMENTGLLQDGDDPSSEQFAKYMNRLNDMINYWSILGIKLWSWVDNTVTLVAGTATYTMPGNPVRAIQGYYLDANSISRPLTVISWDEYERLGNKAQQGPINSFFVNNLVSTINVTFWLVPDTTAALGTAQILLQQQLTNSTMLNDAVNFPQEWFSGLSWGLADEICTGQPASIVARCREKNLEMRTALEASDVEFTDTYFQPTVGSGNAARFR